MKEPMLMAERLINTKLFINFELIKTLNDIDLTLHMGTFETGKADIENYGDENE